MIRLPKTCSTARPVALVAALAALSVAALPTSALAADKATKKLSPGMYHCFSQSQGQAGISAYDVIPAYRLKARGRWVDETFATRKLKGRYRYRAGKLTLFTAKGNKLGTYRTRKDDEGHYFIEQGSDDPLICRKRD